MRIRNIKNADEIVKNNSYVLNNPKEYRGHFNEVFGNDNPIHLEIGMGKGNFLISRALNNPDINFIGIEKYTSIVARALKKLEDLKVPNLKIINGDALELNEFFDKEISTIYLNFSDPWPKDRHAKRRLTSLEHLKLYDSLFKKDKHIIQKTDNDDLFQFSLEQYKEYGYKVNKISYDLHSENIENIKTEYEEKFSNMGIKIKYVEVTK